MKMLVLTFLLLTLIPLSVLAGPPSIQVQKTPSQVLYKINQNFVSSYTKKDIDYILNPRNGRIQQLFQDPISLRSSGGNRYAVESSINAVLQTLHIRNTLDYQVQQSGNKSIHDFNFHSFNMLFISSRIKVIVEEVAGDSRMSISQVAAVKPGPYAKIEKIPFGASQFKKRILSNIRKFHQGVGGR